MTSHQATASSRRKEIIATGLFILAAATFGIADFWRHNRGLGNGSVPAFAFPSSILVVMMSGIFSAVVAVNTNTRQRLIASAAFAVIGALVLTLVWLR